MNKIHNIHTDVQLASILKDILIPYLGDKAILNEYGDLLDRIGELNNRVNKMSLILSNLHKTKYFKTNTHKKIYWKIPKDGNVSKELHVFLQYDFRDNVSSESKAGVIELYFSSAFIEGRSKDGVLNSGANKDFISHLGGLNISLHRDAGTSTNYIGIELDRAGVTFAIVASSMYAWSFSENVKYEILDNIPQSAVAVYSRKMSGEMETLRQEIPDIDKLVRSNDIRWLVPITPEGYELLSSDEKTRPDVEYLVEEEFRPDEDE